MALKIPPLGVVLVSALIMWLLSRLEAGFSLTLPAADAIAAALALLGLSVPIMAVLSFRRALTTVNPMTPQRSTALVSSGVYRLSRNPMYLGLGLLLVAWGVWLRNPLALLVVPAYIGYMNRYQIEVEERMLEGLFGQEYVAYKGRVRRWL